MYIGLRYPKDRKKRHHRKHGSRTQRNDYAKDKEPIKPRKLLILCFDFMLKCNFNALAV